MGHSEEMNREVEVEDRLVPALREGINVVKMIFFKQLKPYLAEKYPADTPEYANRLTGALINEVFATPSDVEPFKTFAEDNRSFIEAEIKLIPETFADLRIPLTDALRIQFLCDDREGVDNQASLSRARELGILIVDRDVREYGFRAFGMDYGRALMNHVHAHYEVEAAFGPPPYNGRTRGGCVIYHRKSLD